MIISLDRIYCTHTKSAWPSEEEKSLATKHFKKLSDKNKNLWDGFVLLSCAHLLEDRILSATFFTTRYSVFCAIRDGLIDIENRPQKIRNLSPVASIICSDNRIVVGRMSRSTSSHNIVTLPGGIPDYNDIDDSGIVDLNLSLERELKEEIGGYCKKIESIPGWLLIIDDWRMIVVKRYHTDHPSCKFSNGTSGEFSDIFTVSVNDEYNYSSWTRIYLDYLRG